MKNFYNQFKTPIVTLVIFFVGLFLYTKLAGPIPFFINSVQTTKNDLFSAQGEGKVTAVPDQATIEAGVTETSTTVSDAQNKVNNKAKQIIDAVKKLGITDKDIKTTNYSVTPNYGSGEPVPMMYPIRGGGNNIVGYTVTQNLEINVKDTSKVNTVIDTATKNGANIASGANFTFSDETKNSLQQKARIMAVNDAKQKAQGLANAAGIKLGRVLNVVESGSNFGIIMPMAAGAAEKTDQNQPTNVTPGENSITIDVTIYYETY